MIWTFWAGLLIADPGEILVGVQGEEVAKVKDCPGMHRSVPVIDEETADGRLLPRLRGPYLGQAGPGDAPKLFAPEIVNTGIFTRDATWTPDGAEFYFRVGLAGFSQSAIIWTRRVGDRWTVPEVAPFSRDRRWRDLEPCLSPDGREIFFTSDRPVGSGRDDRGSFAIWRAERRGARWSEPDRLPPPINEGDAFFPSLTRDGTLYYCKDGPDGNGFIWRVRRRADEYLRPESLPLQVNAGNSRFNAHVAPDESFVILPILGLADSLGGWDLYIVFRRPDDSWSQPINLGPRVNSSAHENPASLSPDGRYLFFGSSRVPAVEKNSAILTFSDIQALARKPGRNGDMALYWIEAGFIQELRPKAVFNK